MDGYYYISKEPENDGVRAVHQAGCEFMPNLSNRAFLGRFDDFSEAIELAERLYEGVEYCVSCCDIESEE